MPIGTMLILNLSRITSEPLVRSGWERHQSICFDLGRMTVPNENQSIGTWHIPIGTKLIFSISRIAPKRVVGSEWERH